MREVATTKKDLCIFIKLNSASDIITLEMKYQKKCLVPTNKSLKKVINVMIRMKC